MKIKLGTLTLLLFVFVSTNVLAQTAPTIVRGVACSVNDGYSMTDVVEFARTIDWNEDMAPSGLFFREAVAVAGEFQMDWDFVISAFYADYADMVSKRSALRNRPGGRAGGATLSDMMTCGARVRISRVNLANEGEIFSDTETTPMGQTQCQLNGATVDDAIARAAAQGQALDAYAAVDVRSFGGPIIQQNSQVSMRFVFPNAESFGDSLDTVFEDGAFVQPDDGITCRNGSLWLSHRIYLAN
tara:strand:- start:1744 stop:2472 length:729 start_codon:yes stop_codon:yes gene_type:complete